MRKLSINLLFLGISAFMFGQKPNAVIMQATTPPVIDGQIDAVWAEANVYNIAVPFQSETPTLGAIGETTWQALWDDNGVYILLKVADNVFYPAYKNSAYDNWMYDKPEIYFDVNSVLADGRGAGTGTGHYTIAPAFDGSKIDGTPTTDMDGIINAFKVTDPTYVAEYFIPFSKLLDKDGVWLDKLKEIGFDVTIIDRDNLAGTRNRLSWSNRGTIDESWNNMDGCGTFVFVGCACQNITDSISLTGGAITTNNGTLQMVAEVLPANANKKLKWTVINSTGRATIDENGILTGVLNGEVIVNAQATDGSWVKSPDVTVTITGQVSEPEEFNIIRNGSFIADGVLPAPWGFWTGNGGAMPVVVDGIAVCAPLTGLNWEYQFNQYGLKALPNIDYIFSFDAWAGADRIITAVFEDSPPNGYSRYGTSTDPESNGTSEWNFGITTIPTRYTFHVNFNMMVPTTIQKVQFMFAQSSEVVYLDNVSLISVADMALLPNLKIDLGTDRVITCGDSIKLAPIIDYNGTYDLSYSWSPSEGLNNANIKNPTAYIKNNTKYKLTITSPDIGTIQDSVLIIVNPLTVSAGADRAVTCDGALQFAKPTTNSTIPVSLSYSWLPAEGLNFTNIARPTVSLITGKTYTLEVTTANGCKATDNVNVTVNPLAVTVNNIGLTCGNEVQIIAATNYSGSGYLAYSWSPTSGLSDPLAPKPIVHVNQATTYSVEVRTPNGCVATNSGTVDVAAISDLPSICMVTVNENDRNQVVIKKEMSAAVESYFIYRESSFQTDQYDLIGILPYSENGVFVDLSSNAKVQSNKYKIAIKDVCGFVTVKSPEHKSMHLTINKGIGTSWNLIWEPYLGFPVSGYVIYRGTTKSDLVQIGNSSGGSTSFTDVNAPAGDVYYQIEVVLPEACVTLKSTAYSSVRSNIISNVEEKIGIFTVPVTQEFIYPNPAQDKIYIRSGYSSNSTIAIFNLQGKQVLTSRYSEEIDITSLSKGIYIVKLIESGKIFVNKLVKEGN